jgi:RNA polymerase sigma factor (sigma-70 family)
MRKALILPLFLVSARPSQLNSRCPPAHLTRPGEMRIDEATSDEQLMERYRDGDAEAFDRLYERHKSGLFRYVLHQCGSGRIAEELFQEVWMNLIRARTAYTVQARFTTYLYRLAHNRLIDHHRIDARNSALSFEEEEGAIENIAGDRGNDPAVAADSREEARRLLQLIDALPEAQREAFVLQQESDMSIEEIAQATGVSRETAKSRLRYAIAKLRAGMAAEPQAREPPVRAGPSL